MSATAEKLVSLDSPFIQFSCDTVGCDRTDSLGYTIRDGETVVLCPHCQKEYLGVSS